MWKQAENEETAEEAPVTDLTRGVAFSRALFATVITQLVLYWRRRAPLGELLKERPTYLANLTSYQHSGADRRPAVRYAASYWLPTGWAILGQLLPPGASSSLARADSFFDRAGAGAPALAA